MHASGQSPHAALPQIRIVSRTANPGATRRAQSKLCRSARTAESEPSVGTPLELVHDVEPVGHLSEHRVLAIEPGGRRGGDDEERRSVWCSGPALAIASAARE